jgi:alpha-glucosidase (family GH31 glycosyl hydrolase)
LSDITGRPDLPAPWVFGPWNDAIRGSERVREVAATLADAGAPTTAIWTEDWKGGEEDATGYHLTGEWFLDEDLYPDAAEIDAELESDGLAWLAYFSPFLFEGTETWDEADAAGVIVKTVEGEPYTFLGATLDPTGLLDLSTQPGRDFAIDRMHGAMNLGFEGWMADFAEWLPADAILNNGSVGLDVHNIYPQWWQVTNAEAVAGTDAAFFVRSGWTYTAGMVPVVWGGDQRTDFQTDDGLPSVVAMGLGLGASGVPTFTHDVAGYQSFLNEPSDKEVWFRWSWLGAFSPIHRTHHGAFDTANWAFDRDEETLAFHAQVTTEHMRLFPYRYGLAGRASRDGTPAVLPVAFVHGGDDWGRLDAWMLGDALLVAPVTEPGVAGREVELPTGTAWYGWFDHNPVSSGWVDSPMDTIPVFAASGTTVPTFTTVPQSVRDPAQFDAADAERTVTLFGDGGRFVEADGTTYTPRGVALGSGTVTARLKSGEVDVGGLTVAIAGPTERSYTLVVVK